MANIKPLSTIDAAWLRMEDPTNLMMVSGVLTFRKPLDIDLLRTVIEHRLLKFDRFRMRVVSPRLPLVPAYWEFDPNFNLDAHIHHIALPEPGDKESLQALSGDLMSTPLDFSKPLWMMHVIENYEGGTAVFVRLHHCIADGMALVFVLLSLTDFGPKVAIPADDEKPKQPRSQRGLFGGSLTAMLKQTSAAAKTAVGLTGKMVSESQAALKQPSHVFEVAQWGGENALAAGRLALRRNDPPTLFKGKLGTQKRAAWSRPLSLEKVKAVKNVTGSTVNDVLISALTGGLRRYLENHDQETHGLSFRAAIPVNLRKPDEMGTLGNKFGLFFLDLPVGIADTLDRLSEVHQRMEELKASKEGPVGLAILSGLGVAPTELYGPLLEMFGKKLTAVMTNVPGPPMPLYMAGERIDNLMFWVPQSGRVGLGISIISYAGSVYLGVATDAGLVPNPDELITGFYEEFDDLMALVEQAEWVAKAESDKVEKSETRTTVPINNEELQNINGIGPTYASRLEAAGIQTIAELSATSPKKVAEILRTSGSRAEKILSEAQKNGV